MEGNVKRVYSKKKMYVSCASQAFMCGGVPAARSMQACRERQKKFRKDIINGAYALMVSAMHLSVLYVLFVKVMPVFGQVYALLGAAIPPVFAAVFRIGGIFSGVALILLFLGAMLVMALALYCGIETEDGIELKEAAANNLKAGLEDVMEALFESAAVWILLSVMFCLAGVLAGIR